MLVIDILTETSNEMEDASKPIITRGEPCTGVSYKNRKLTLYAGDSSSSRACTYGEVRDFIKKMKIDELSAVMIDDCGQVSAARACTRWHDEFMID